MGDFESQSCSVVSDCLRPHGLYSPWNSPGQNTGVGSLPSPEDLPNPGIEPRFCTLQVVSLPAEPQGKHGLLWRASFFHSVKIGKTCQGGRMKIHF